jgi:hypothetical protein
MSKASAFISGRDFVSPKDVMNVYLSALCHRVILSSAAENRKITAEQALRAVFQSVKPPRILHDKKLADFYRHRRGAVFLFRLSSVFIIDLACFFTVFKFAAAVGADKPADDDFRRVRRR